MSANRRNCAIFSFLVLFCFYSKKRHMKSHVGVVESCFKKQMGTVREDGWGSDESLGGRNSLMLN